MIIKDLSRKMFKVAPLLLVGLSMSANAELLTNPGFEDDFDGFSTFNQGFRIGGSGDANSGSNGLVNDVLSGDSDNLRGVLQSVAATPGDGYTFSAFIRGVSVDRTEAFLELVFKDAGGSNIGSAFESARITADQGFTIATISEQIAPAGTATVQVAGLVLVDLGITNAGNDFIIFDDFSLTTTAVPEPATLGLVGLGLLCLAGRRRK